MIKNTKTISIYFFFFQAEDGIRDLTVTGVQTCALPISRTDARAGFLWRGARRDSEKPVQLEEVQPRVLAVELRYAVRVAHPGAQLHELHGRQLVQQAPASLCSVRYAPVRIEVLARHLEIVAAGERPVGFHQSREHLHPATGKAVVIY